MEEQFEDLKDMCLSCNYVLKGFLEKEKFPKARSMIITHDFVNVDIVKTIIEKNKIV